MASEVLLSVPQAFTGSGPSRPLQHIADALSETYADNATVLTREHFPQFAGDWNRLGDAKAAAYDDAAAQHLEQEYGLPQDRPDVALIGGGASLRQARFLQEDVLMGDDTEVGKKVGTLWFSSYWKYTQQTLAEEYAHYGMDHHPIHPYLCWRAQQEQQASDFLIVPSEPCKRTYPNDWHDKVHVCEFGVDTDRFHPPTDPTPRSQDTPLKVLYSATNPPRKGLRYVLDAIQQLPKNTIHLHTTGLNPDQPFPYEGQSITHHGWVPEEDLPGLYREVDAFLLPSLEEGLALQTLEAMASGLPIVVTERTGAPITHNDEGLIIPEKSPAAIKDALKALHKYPDQAHKMGLWGRELVTNSYTWTDFQDRVLTVVREYT